MTWIDRIWMKVLLRFETAGKSELEIQKELQEIRMDLEIELEEERWRIYGNR